MFECQAQFVGGAVFLVLGVELLTTGIGIKGLIVDIDRLEGQLQFLSEEVVTGEVQLDMVIGVNV